MYAQTIRIHRRIFTGVRWHNTRGAKTNALGEDLLFTDAVYTKSTDTKKQSPNTGARANYNLHKQLGYPIGEPARQREHTRTANIHIENLLNGEQRP